MHLIAAQESVLRHVCMGLHDRSCGFCLEGNARASINHECPRGELQFEYNSTCYSSLAKVLNSVQ